MRSLGTTIVVCRRTFPSSRGLISYAGTIADPSTRYASVACEGKAGPVTAARSRNVGTSAFGLGYVARGEVPVWADDPSRRRLPQ